MADQKLKRLSKRIVMVCGTLVVLAGAGAAVAVGSDVLAERAADAPAPAASPLVPVSVKPITFETTYTTERRFLGQIEAGTDAVLSFELNGQLAELTVGEGDYVAQGDVVARLDTSLLEAEHQRLIASRDALRAQLTFANNRLSRAENLQADGFTSQETLDQSRASVDELNSRIREVDAAILATTINIGKSVLYAPFAGRVGAQDVTRMETLAAGQPVLTLIETTAPQVLVGLPLHLAAEALSDVVIEVNGAQYPASLDQFRPDIDPGTRTRTALFSIETDTEFAFGQSASVVLETEVAATGAWIGLDALQQGSGSIWTILVVDNDTVRTAAVEVLYLQEDRAFVRGSFTEGTSLITSGAHRVVPGQQVQILMAEG